MVAVVVAVVLALELAEVDAVVVAEEVADEDADVDAVVVCDVTSQSMKLPLRNRSITSFSSAAISSHPLVG